MDGKTRRFLEQTGKADWPKGEPPTRTFTLADIERALVAHGPVPGADLQCSCSNGKWTDEHFINALRELPI